MSSPFIQYISCNFIVSVVVILYRLRYYFIPCAAEANCLSFYWTIMNSELESESESYPHTEVYRYGYGV